MRREIPTPGPSTPQRGARLGRGDIPMTPILEARGLSRSFGHVRALNKADFDIDAGRGRRAHR